MKTNNKVEYFSQHGQDKWISEKVFPGLNEGFFIELGAGDGKVISNTLSLEKYHNWRGILIEPSDKFKALSQNRKENILVNGCISSEVGTKYLVLLSGPGYEAELPHNNFRSFVVSSLEEMDNTYLESPFNCYVRELPNRPKTTEVHSLTLESVLDQNNSPKVIHFLSLDVEGHEYEVLKNFPFKKYRLLSMVVEKPCLKLQNLLQENNFVCVDQNTCDLCYVNKEILFKYLSRNFFAYIIFKIKSVYFHFKKRLRTFIK